MFYKLVIKPLLFLLRPEAAHHFVFRLIKLTFRLPAKTNIIQNLYAVRSDKLKRELMGLTFENPVGLAAGFDKDAKMVDELSSYGFGFIEIGTVTPLAQAGNPRPRLFRLKADEALINRMGFNNDGAAAVALRLKSRSSKIIVGGNIGKNKNTNNEQAVDDYGKCFNELFDVVHYFVVNVSSPNTPDLRGLQDKKPLTELLSKLQEINFSKPKPKPMLLKIAPDLSNEQLDEIIAIVKQTKLQGIVATNTTISRANLKTSENELKTIGAGGLSGRPIANRSTEVIRYIAERSKKEFVIIGVGGIHSPEDALEKLEAGADLIQLYTGFIYEGPALIKKINKKILAASDPD